MYDYAQINKINNKKIIVIPLMTEHCMGCANHCNLEQGKPFLVANPQNLDVKAGQFVKIGANRKAQSKQALYGIIIPAIFAIIGWFVAGKIAAILGKTAGDGIHILGFFVGIIGSMLAILGITHKKTLDASYIEKIVDTNEEEIRKNACLTHL